MHKNNTKYIRCIMLLNYIFLFICESFKEIEPSCYIHKCSARANRKKTVKACVKVRWSVSRTASHVMASGE